MIIGHGLDDVHWTHHDVLTQRVDVGDSNLEISRFPEFWGFKKARFQKSIKSGLHLPLPYCDIEILKKSQKSRHFWTPKKHGLEKAVLAFLVKFARNRSTYYTPFTPVSIFPGGAKTDFSAGFLPFCY